MLPLVSEEGEPRPDRTVWTEADFYRPSGHDLLCTLCPYACRLSEGEVGRCEVRRRTGGRLETATRALAVRHWDAVEKKPLYHFRPGSTALTLAAPGCSFACNYCLNYRLAQPESGAVDGWDSTLADPEAIVREAETKGASVALSYSEPSLAAELTLDLARAAHGRDVPLLWKTNGFLTGRALADLAPALDAVNLDLKAIDEKRHRALTGCDLAPVLETLEGLVASGVWVEVSTPVIPDFNDDDASLRAMARRLRQVSPDIPWHCVRFVPELRMQKFRPTPPEALARAAELGREEGLRFVYVERALGEAGRETRCPSCETPAVRRGIWTTDEVELHHGACPECGTPIPGRWARRAA